MEISYYFYACNQLINMLGFNSFLFNVSNKYVSMCCTIILQLTVAIKLVSASERNLKKNENIYIHIFAEHWNICFVHKKVLIIANTVLLMRCKDKIYKDVN